MSVGLMIVTHGQIGHALIQAAEFILDRSLERIRCVAVTQSGTEMPDESVLREVIDGADEGDGVLVLTDLACASPSNCVEQQIEGCHARVVSGVNLPMLLRTWNYRDEPLDQLVERAVQGGLKGIGLRGIELKDE